ncbi:hypothetical protein ACO0RG_003957 [Hanseniaspora osmophila]|mgnify:FL=1
MSSIQSRQASTQSNGMSSKEHGSSSSIESSVTKLIISTKNLLQKLTAWTRGEETQKTISDAYVQLGNDFQLVVKQFVHAGVDMQDMRNVPKELRGILEKALREKPSNEALDRYWPSIKDIIESLLTKIKTKRVILKQIENQKKNRASSNSLLSQISSTSSPSSSSSSSISSSFSVPSATVTQPQASLSPYNMLKTKQLPAQPESNPTNPVQTRRRSSSRILLSPEDLKPEATEPNFAEKTNNTAQSKATLAEDSSHKALAQLKKGDTIQRRASKRFSAYHIAKLTSTTSASATHPLPASMSQRETPVLESGHNEPELSSGKPTVFGVDMPKASKFEDNLTGDQQIKSPSSTFKPVAVFSDQRITSSEHRFINIFLKHQEHIKKITTTYPVLNKNTIIMLFAEKFSINYESDCLLYLRDPQYPHVSYDFDESEINTISDGFVIELVFSNAEKSESNEMIGNKQSEQNLAPTESTHETFQVLEQRLLASNAEMFKNLEKLISKNNIPCTDSSSNLAVTPLNFESKTCLAETNLSQETKLKTIEELKRDVLVLKQIQTENKTKIENSVASVVSQLAKLDPIKLLAAKDEAEDDATLANGKKTSDRHYLEASQSKLSELSENLLTNVDDLQDTVEMLRKDVALRGSQPKKRKFDEVKKELDEALEQLQEMQKFLQVEKPFWKKVWEAELEKVCDEQQFINLQEDLYFDLQEDLKRCQETFHLVELCCEEQAKLKNVNKEKSKSDLDLSSKVILPLVKPGTMHEVREAVLNNIIELQPDHESRLEAIKKTEKHREKEKEMILNDEFNEELGNFVEKSQLNKSGGIEELERLRMEKDAENLRNMMSK